jgi:hypothetical protein
MIAACRTITMAQRNGCRRLCRSLQCRCAGLIRQAYASRERPARWRNPINSMSYPFCSLLEQHRGWRRGSMLLRKWSRKRPRQSADPVPLCVFDRGGLGDPKISLLDRSEPFFASKYRFWCHGQGWRMKKRKKIKNKYGTDKPIYLTLLATRHTLLEFKKIQQLRASNVDAMLRLATGISDPTHCTSVLYDDWCAYMRT